MTAAFINQTSRVAIAGRVAELQRQSRSLDEWIPAGRHYPTSHSARLRPAWKRPSGCARSNSPRPTQRALRTGAVAIGSANQMRGQSD